MGSNPRRVFYSLMLSRPAFTTLRAEFLNLNSPHTLCTKCKSHSFKNTKYMSGIATKLEFKTGMSKSLNDIGPVSTKLDTPEFQSLFTPGLQNVQDVFGRYGFQLAIAGGAVRDLLMGLKPQDVDFATTATPDEMKKMFTNENIRMINSGGESHGTVTCRCCDENFEITTLRIDRITDGRHAVVEFTKDWSVDASRRDLTINSIFLDLHGNVVDYFNGMDDLNNKRVRFVGNPCSRVREDYLRILRYFRFFGRITDSGCDFDEDAIEAIKSLGGGMKSISGPRIWSEMRQILEGHHVQKILRKMHSCGIFPYLGFPENVDLDLFDRIYHQTTHLNLHYMTPVSALLKNEDDVYNLEMRVQFSRKERKIALFIVRYRDKIRIGDPDRMKFCQDILVDNPPGEGCCREFVVELLKYIGDFETMEHIKDWKIPRFPVNGRMAMEAGVPKGKQVGVVLRILKTKWKESHYLLSADELLSNVDNIIKTL